MQNNTKHKKDTPNKPLLSNHDTSIQQNDAGTTNAINDTVNNHSLFGRFCIKLCTCLSSCCKEVGEEIGKVASGIGPSGVL